MLSRRLSPFLLFVLVNAGALEPTEQPVSTGCAIDGNADFYGLGVRIGIYCVWLSSWLANNWLADEITDTLATNTIFLLSLFFTVFYYSVKTNAIRVIDVVVIHQLCGGFLLSVMSLWGYRTKYYMIEGPGGRRHFGGFGTHFRLLLMASVSVYGCWFWIYGVGNGLPDIDRRINCGGLKTFFFCSNKGVALVNKRHPACHSNSLGHLLWCSMETGLVIDFLPHLGIALVAAIVGGCYYLVQRQLGSKISWNILSNPDSNTLPPTRELTLSYHNLRIFNVFWIVFSIVSIELTIQLNHMRNILSLWNLGPGQLIPGSIGTISLVRICYIIVRGQIRPMDGAKVPLSDSDHHNSEGERANRVPTAMSQRHNWSRVPDGAVAGSKFDQARQALHQRPQFLRRLAFAWLPWLSLFSFIRQPSSIDEARAQSWHHLDRTGEDHVGLLGGRSPLMPMQSRSPESEVPSEATPRMP